LYAETLSEAAADALRTHTSQEKDGAAELLKTGEVAGGALVPQDKENANLADGAQYTPLAGRPG
jgi:hypothetical protein